LRDFEPHAATATRGFFDPGTATATLGDAAHDGEANAGAISA
jgi:hypothetical protein